MGEVVGAGVLAHVPTIMLPESERRQLNGGQDTSLVAGLHRLRAEVFDVRDYDTVVVIDTHWASTVEYLVAAQDRRAGLYTAEELPRGMCRIPYDFTGDPELAESIAAQGDAHGTWITAISDHYLPIMYGTVNLWTFLGRPDRRWVSMSCCQTADVEDNLRAGRALGAAIAATDRKVLLIGSGALSHTFHPLRALRDHEAAGIEHIFTPEAAEADRERLDWFAVGDHARVLATMPEFLRYRPEARFAHYLIMVAALGGGAVTAAGRLFSRYENSVGTGQVHVWFDRPPGGWTATAVTTAAGAASKAAT